MKKIISTALIVTILFTTILTNSAVFAESASRFGDVADTYWAISYIDSLKTSGIIDGYPDGTFKPSANVKINEFIAMTVKALDYNYETSSSGWDKPYIEKAIELGIIGVNEFSNYDTQINREQMASIIVNAVSLSEQRPNSEFDTYIEMETIDFDKISSTYKKNVLDSFKLGIVTGYPDKSFAPKKASTRAEASVVIVKLLDKNLRNPYDKGANFNDVVPEYLQKRFALIRKEFRLTWTDEDFENWFNSTPKLIRDQYIDNWFDAADRTTTFDFENKVVLVDWSTMGGYKENKLINLNDYDGKFGVNDLGYIAYEMYKRNVEMMVKDGVDYGWFGFGHVIDAGVLNIVVGDDDNRKSLDWLLKSEELRGSDFHTSDFTHMLVDQTDWKLLSEDWNTYEEWTQDYVVKFTKLNYHLMYGQKIGQELFNNFMLAYKGSFTSGANYVVDESLHKETSDYSLYYQNEGIRAQMIYIK